MKNIAFILLLYNLLSIQLLYTDWIYKEVYINLWMLGSYQTHWYNVIDTIDFPFYVIWGFIFLKGLYKIKKYFTNFQWFCNFGCISFVTMIWINSLCECITLPSIIFWGRFIVFFTLFAYVVTKINFDRFKR